MKKRYCLVVTIIIFLSSLFSVFAGQYDEWKECNAGSASLGDQAFLSQYCCKSTSWAWGTIANCKPSVLVAHSPSGSNPPKPDNTDSITITATGSDDESGMKTVRIYVDLNQDSDYVDLGEQKDCASATCAYSIGKFAAGTRICYYAFAYDNYDYLDYTPTQCFTVNSAACSVHTDSTSCNNDAACDWCSECSANKYSGGDSRCVGAGTCSYSCLAGQCSATCTSSTNSLWSGTSCSYNCGTASTCKYSSSCTTKCSSPNTYCKGSDNYCYYSVGCTGSGCAALKGNPCPAGTCDSNGNCAITTPQCVLGGVCATPGSSCCANNKLYRCQ